MNKTEDLDFFTKALGEISLKDFSFVKYECRTGCSNIHICKICKSRINTGMIYYLWLKYKNGTHCPECAFKLYALNKLKN